MEKMVDAIKKIVPPTGFEPARPNGQGILSPLCLN